MVQANLKKLEAASWADITAQQPEYTKTPIERCDPNVLPDVQQHWREHGYVVIPKLVPDSVLDAYSEVRERLPRDRKAKDNYWGGWAEPTPYLQCTEMLTVATYPELIQRINSLIGDAMAPHLALTGWVSTERAWHQDSYLNPGTLWSWYAAVWIALDNVTEDSGPFEFVPGSHTWPTMRKDLLFDAMPPEWATDPAWPTLTQNEVARICEAEVQRRAAKVERFLPEKGDVLIWHSNLMHRGSEPSNPFALRKALICHYSSIIRRQDMNHLARSPVTGQLYFDFPERR